MTWNLRTSIFCLFVFLVVPQTKAITIADKGSSDYVIVIAADASTSEKHAAEELQFFINKIASVKLPILTETAEPGKKMILIGKVRLSTVLNQVSNFQR